MLYGVVTLWAWLKKNALIMGVICIWVRFCFFGFGGELTAS